MDTGEEIFVAGCPHGDCDESRPCICVTGLDGVHHSIPHSQLGTNDQEATRVFRERTGLVHMSVRILDPGPPVAVVVGHRR